MNKVQREQPLIVLIMTRLTKHNFASWRILINIIVDMFIYILYIRGFQTYQPATAEITASTAAQMHN